jgi:hypothetical protein
MTEEHHEILNNVVEPAQIRTGHPSTMSKKQYRFGQRDLSEILLRGWQSLSRSRKHPIFMDSETNAIQRRTNPIHTQFV